MPDNGQKKKRGVSYPPYMADAKEETPNGKNGMTKQESAGLKYRERNEEKLRADARSTKRNLHKPKYNPVKFIQATTTIGLYKKSLILYG